MNGFQLINGTVKRGGSFAYRLIDRITDLSYHALALLWLFIVIGFACAYFLLGYVTGHGPLQLEGLPSLIRFFDSLYYSVITATSTGYGDITPVGFSKFLAATQSITSLFIFAVLVTKLVSRRQDIALRQIHKLSFEDVFHNIREGFFIVRKDFNRLIAKIEHQNNLDQHDWDDLMTAYRQAQSFLRRITDFYDAENRIYVIDERREELLQDGVKRTLQRVQKLIATMQKKNIPWTKNNPSLEELREFIQLVTKIIHFWMEQSPYRRIVEFEELLNINDKIHESIEDEVGK